MPKIAIIGSREFSNKDLFDLVVSKLLVIKELSIITGGAIGVDSWAMEFCKKHNIQCEIIRPINPDNKVSYLFRNVEILTKADAVLAFWDGKSRGTKFVIDYAVARNKKIRVIKQDGDGELNNFILQ